MEKLEAYYAAGGKL